jgi:hypothetical protein
VTYRDDLDASIARAESLEEQVAELERERDRLRHELEVAKQPPPPAPVATAAPTLPGLPPVHLELALQQAELAELVQTLEYSLRSSRNHAGLVVGGLIGIVLGVMALMAQLVGLGLVLGGTGLLMCMSFVTNLIDAPGDGRSIIEAVRDEPDRIVSASEQSTRSGRQLVISTTTGSLRVETRDTAKVLALLARRCPHARFGNDP